MKIKMHIESKSSSDLCVVTLWFDDVLGGSLIMKVIDAGYLRGIFCNGINDHDQIDTTIRGSDG